MAQVGEVDSFSEPGIQGNKVLSKVRYDLIVEGDVHDALTVLLHITLEVQVSHRED